MEMNEWCKSYEITTRKWPWLLITTLSFISKDVHENWCQKTSKTGIHTEKWWRHMNRWAYEVVSCLLSVMEISHDRSCCSSCIQFLFLDAEFGDEAIPVSIVPLLKVFPFSSSVSFLILSDKNTLIMRQNRFLGSSKVEEPSLSKTYSS